MHRQDQFSAAVALRLVNARVAEPPRPIRRPVVVDAPSWRVAPAPTEKPNPALTGDDPRWLLARRVLEQLQGGPAAILPPESRSRLNALGRRLGLRTFDISLVIAIAQDHARHTPTGNGDAWTTLQSRLRLVPTPASGLHARPPNKPQSLLPWALASLAIAAGTVAVAALWVVR